MGMIGDWMARISGQSEEDRRKRREQLQEQQILRLRKRFEGAPHAKLIKELEGLCRRWSANEHDDKMEALAQAIGHEFDRRGGMTAMRSAWKELSGTPGSRTLEMWWGGIGDWRG